MLARLVGTCVRITWGLFSKPLKPPQPSTPPHATLKVLRDPFEPLERTVSLGWGQEKRPTATSPRSFSCFNSGRCPFGYASSLTDRAFTLHRGCP